MLQSLRIETVSRCWVFVNWQSKEIDGVYSETNLSLLALAGDAAYEAGIDESIMQDCIYRRDFEQANDYLAKGKSSYVIVPAWFVPPLDVAR